MKRRDVLIGGLASGAVAIAAGGARAAETASREFRVMRDGSDIGRHRLAARLDGDVFEIAIDIELRIKVLGITAYRYNLENRERWQNRQIVEVSTKVNDDGTADFARIRRVGDGLYVEGSGWSGAAPLDAVTTSYFARAMVDRRPWISTQSGKILEVETRPSSAGPNIIDVTGELETRLAYDGRGEWLGCQFDAGGEPATYEMIDESGAIVPLWTAA